VSWFLLKKVVSGVWCGGWGGNLGEFTMRKLILAAAVLAAVPLQEASAAGKCYSQTDIEAEQAILFQTKVMVVSSACQNTTYAEFRLRNKDAIIAYQKAMIDHFRRAGQRKPDMYFESYITGLANEASRNQNGVPTYQVCQQAEELMKLAGSLDTPGFRQYAATQAVSAGANYTRCSR
jgi:hypothetical protein